MNIQSPIHKQKRGYSIAEYSVFIIVIGILCAAVIPIFIRMSAYKRNVQRITDVKTISQQVTTFNTKSGAFPQSLRALKNAGLGEVPKDPSTREYCTGTPGYESGDYQYYTCKDCEAIGPLKTYTMNTIAQVGALMEWENKRGERNSGNRWSPYKLGDDTNCGANGIRGAGTLVEGARGNWIGGTGSDVTSIMTNSTQKDYEPRYNIIISSERK